MELRDRHGSLREPIIARYYELSVAADARGSGLSRRED